MSDKASEAKGSVGTLEDEESKTYGWYSEQFASELGYSIYEDIYGKEVKANILHATKECPISKLPQDLKYVGILVKLLKHVWNLAD